MRISLQIIKFFALIWPPSKVPLICTNRFAEIRCSNNNSIGDFFSGGIWIAEHRNDAPALQFIGRCNVAQFRKRWKKIDEFDESFAGGTGAGLTRDADHKRHSIAGFEQHHLAPHEFLTQQITVIGGEHDNRVVPLSTAFESVEDDANLGVDEGNAGMVGLHVFPTKRIVLHAEFETESLVAFRTGDRRGLLPELQRGRCELQFRRRIHSKILVRRDERYVRFLDAAGHEEGLLPVRLILQPFGDLAGVLSVFVLCVRQACRAPTGFLPLRLLGDRRIKLAPQTA